MIVTLLQCHSGEQIKKNEKRKACVIYGGKMWCVKGLGEGRGGGLEGKRPFGRSRCIC